LSPALDSQPFACPPGNPLADEQLFGFTRGVETLPQGRSELYQYVTARTGKAEGDYLGLDIETEAEHGFTDKFQASILLAQHYFNNYGVDGSRDALNDSNKYRIGGLATSALLILHIWLGRRSMR
jgi:hypothetical protein